MALKLESGAVVSCHGVLSSIQDYNNDKKIYPSWNVVINRLLIHSVDLEKAYSELYEKLNKHPHALNKVLESLVRLSASFCPEKIRLEREKKQDIERLNKEIENAATLLSSLLQKKNELTSTGGFMCSGDSSVLSLIMAASGNNGHFDTHVKGKIAQLEYQYDSKYWPELSACLAVLANDMANSYVESTDPIIEGQINKTRAGTLTHFVEAFLEVIDENRSANYGFVPNDFSLTDSSLATLVNCSLGLDPSELKGSEFIKNVRSRVRKSD